MRVRHAQIERLSAGAGTFGAALAAATAAVVARAAGREAVVALALFVAAEVVAAFSRARVAAGPRSRSRAGALARLAVGFAATLATSLLARLGAGDGERAACLAALFFVLLVLPAAPMAGARLLEAQLARQMPQLVAARLGARIGVTAALAGPAALLLLQRVRADTPSLVALATVTAFLLAGTRRARNDAFVRELMLQARREDSGITPALRAKLLATPLDPDVAALRPLTPEQFQSFRGACERAHSRQ